MTAFHAAYNCTDDALNRVRHHNRSGHSGVFMTQITLWHLARSTINVNMRDRSIVLPVLRSSRGTVFITTTDARSCLGVDVAVSQQSEWFALDYIPLSEISAIQHF